MRLYREGGDAFEHTVNKENEYCTVKCGQYTSGEGKISHRAVTSRHYIQNYTHKHKRALGHIITCVCKGSWIVR